MTRRRHCCANPLCPDCHPERWQPTDDQYEDYKGLTWPWSVLLVGLLVTLAFVFASGTAP